MRSSRQFSERYCPFQEARHSRFGLLVTLLPESLDDWVDESNPVRVIDAFVDALNVAELGFDGVEPAATGPPSYHPSSLLKLYIYGYLNRYSRAGGWSARLGATSR